MDHDYHSAHMWNFVYSIAGNVSIGCSNHLKPVMELRSSLVDQEKLSITLIFEDIEFEVGDFFVMGPDDSIDLFVFSTKVIDVQFVGFHQKRYVNKLSENS